ncbi:hypothetical protein L2E82_33869 [Cichorium intybus]|uniref:Uncharacterized protein n=1 Tax=Cichorium intybus TaxID=13427 RepID=A0ACB9BLI7_CICIN|nr:hypothetical protein L2E82_33869 [Cichorium intybus]
MNYGSLDLHLVLGIFEGFTGRYLQSEQKSTTDSGKGKANTACRDNKKGGLISIQTSGGLLEQKEGAERQNEADWLIIWEHDYMDSLNWKEMERTIEIEQFNMYGFWIVKQQGKWKESVRGR